ncbi:hypothetical protein [uncultured Neglectibacter sp.]|uniref:hypothetical protein n=1 Tax=uncultured Neglectibacter sp. TaxID=1924108 RepID=UPI0034DE75AB
MNYIDKGKEAVEEMLKKVGDVPISSLHSESFIDELKDVFPVFDDEIDTTFLIELLYYFPIDKTYISTGSYDQYLYDLEKTVIDNYESGNYQVSYFYAHLIFMSYVYYCVEKAYQFEPERMKDIFYPINSYRGRDDKPDIENFGSVYEFSKIPEKDIFKVFHVMGMEDRIIREFSKYVSSRDDYAHATGHGNLSEEEYRRNIENVIGNMSTLHKLFLPHIEKLYINFMLERLDCEYDIVMDNFNDFIFDNALSINDIDYLCHLGIGKLQDSNATLKNEYQATRNIHCTFIEFCKKNDGIEPPEGYTSLRNDKYLFYRYKGHADDYIENELGISAYRCVKDGGEFPVYECPECGETQLAYDAENEKFHCFSCDEDFTPDDISFCERCGSIMRRNDDMGICQNCIDYYEHA